VSTVLAHELLPTFEADAIALFSLQRLLEYAFRFAPVIAGHLPYTPWMSFA